MEQAMGFVQFAGLFFTWWGFFIGMLIGGSAVALGLVGVAPVVYRVWRRQRLRKQWRLDLPRAIPVDLTPKWGPYDLDNPTVDRRCICHNRRLYEGENVLHWPEVGPMGVLHTAIYCESVKEQV